MLEKKPAACTKNRNKICRWPLRWRWGEDILFGLQGQLLQKCSW